MKSPRTLLTALLFAPLAVLHAADTTATKPNIIVMLADDMGYGDPGCYNPKSKIATPHIDRLAREGMRFTDAHAPGPLCHPSRYGLLTGTVSVPHRHLAVAKAAVDRGRADDHRVAAQVARVSHRDGGEVASRFSGGWLRQAAARRTGGVRI